jgi:RNA polymerase sigma factor (sigma-70 family)
MSSSARPTVLLHHLRQLIETQNMGKLSDRDLLQRFAAQHDEAAFAALLRRHGPMVLRACQRVLHHEHDAEDVFQATFLVLARKAVSLRWHDSIAGWLHQVAHHLALKVKRGTSRRLIREQQQVQRSPGDPLADVSGRELVVVLDEELALLPEKYRSPLVLCLLEGRTRDEAARQLGYSVRTVKRRLERGRDLLAHRLTRRGLMLSAALSGALLPPTASALPPGLLQSTTQAALLFAAGQAAVGGSISTPVAALTQGVIKAMFWTKCKFVAAAFLTAAALGLGSGALVWQRSEAATGEPDARAVPAGRADRQPAHADGARDAEVWELWATLKGRLEKDGATPVYSAAFSPDGKRLATAYADGFVRFWDVATGKQLATDLSHVRLEGLMRIDEVRRWDVRAVAFSPDGKRLVSAGGDTAVKVWDPATGKEVRAFHHTDAVLSVAFSPDGTILASGGGDEKVRLWDPATGKALRLIALDDGAIMSLAFTADGKTLVVGGVDPDVIVINVETGEVMRHLKGHTREIHSVVASPDGKLLATASRDKTVRLWDVATGKQLICLEGHEGLVTSAAFSRDGKRLATGGKDKTVRIWDLETGKLVATLTGHAGTVYCVIFSPDGRTLATASEDGTVRLWSRKAGHGEESGVAKPDARDDRFDKLLDELLKAKKSDEQIIEALYLATLARLPQENEKTFLLRQLERQQERRQEAFADVLFTLINSKEFFAHIDALKQRDPRQKRE